MADYIKQHIKKHAEEAHPEECCGLIVYANDDITIPIRCKNIAENKLENFVIDPLDYLKCSKFGEIKACYHSHPKGGSISEKDKISLTGHNIPMFIYSNNQLLEFKPEQVEIHELIGRSYKIGETDCLQLVVDYYKNLGIEISHYNRGEDWQQINPSGFVDNFEREGFINILSRNQDLKEIARKNDLILVKFNLDYPTLIAIYLGDGTILLHQENRLSQIDFYTEPLQRRTTHVLRHESLLN